MSENIGVILGFAVITSARAMPVLPLACFIEIMLNHVFPAHVTGRRVTPSALENISHRLQFQVRRVGCPENFEQTLRNFRSFVVVLDITRPELRAGKIIRIVEHPLEPHKNGVGSEELLRFEWKTRNWFVVAYRKFKGWDIEFWSRGIARQ